MRSAPKDAALLGMGPVLLGSMPGGATVNTYQVPPGLLAAGFRHLQVKARLHSSRSGYNSTGMSFYANGDQSASSTYSYTGWFGGAAQGNASGQTLAYLGIIPAGNTGYDTCGHLTLDLPNALEQSVSSVRKQYLFQTHAYGGSDFYVTGGGLIGAVTAPLTSLSFRDDVGTALDGPTRFDFYAIP